MNNLQKLSTIMAITLLASACALAKSEKRDDAGHVLINDWKEYYKAESADLPQTQEKILAGLLKKAETRKLDWDFYDAAGKYCTAVSSYDWKKASEVLKDLKKRIMDYGSPVVLWNAGYNPPFYLDIPDISELAADKKLIHKKNDQFYRNDRFLQNNFLKGSSGTLPEAILESIENDYEYLLWSAFMRGKEYSSDPDEKSDSLRSLPFATKTLKEYYHGQYPQAAYIEFVETTRIPEDSTELRKTALEKYMDKYRDKGMRFFAMMELLEMEFEALQDSDDAEQEDYLALRKKCSDFEKERKAEKTEAALLEKCTYPAELVKMLDFKRIKAEFKDNTDTLEISLQNLGKVRVRLMDRDSAVIMDTVLENEIRSYYLPDTLKFTFSGIDDGDYIVKCSSEDTETSFRYERYTVSLAIQRQEQGIAVYAADFMSGQPVEKADIGIFLKDSLIMSIPGMSFDGFTLMEADFPEAGSRYGIQCSYTDINGLLRKSEIQRFTPAPTASTDSGHEQKCIILKDRAAFNPGDTLKFKAILYETFTDTASGWTKTRHRVCMTGKTITAELKDAAGNMIERKDLTVNEFGSASGCFGLPSDRRNGAFALSIAHNGKTLATSLLTVDEFELPTFNAVFEPLDAIYFPGDTITVKGRIESYSGRSLAASDISYSVALWDDVQKEGKLDIAPDGSFSLSFTAGDGRNDSEKEQAGNGDNEYFYHNINIKIIDATGETHVFNTGIIVDGFYFSADIENKAEGYAGYAGGRWVKTDTTARAADMYGCEILEGDFAIVSFDLRNAGHDPAYSEKITYSVFRQGEQIIAGEAVSGEKNRIDLSAWPSGVYRLKASVEVSGRTRTCVYDLVKTADSDEVLGDPFHCFFKILPSEDISFQFGASCGPVWAVVQLFGGRDTCLKSEMIHLKGIRGEQGSLKKISFDFMDEYPDAVELKITYFRDGGIHEFSHDFKRAMSDMSVPLIFSRFTDKAIPGEKCIYEITTLPGVECAVSVFDITTEAIRTNWWRRINPVYTLTSVYRTYSAGHIDGSGSSSSFRWSRSVGFGSRNSMIPFQLTESKPAFSMDAAAESSSVQNTLMRKSSGGLGISAPEISIRNNFADALAFYPFLRSDENGKISFEFTAGDKLSTYYVALFAHNKSMNNNTLRQKILISLPVTVSVAQPAYLFSGDKYDLSVALSNVSDTDSEGTLSLYLYDGNDYESLSPAMVMSKPAKIRKNSASAEIFSLDIPYNIDTLGIKVVYHATDGASDGLFVSVPVSEPVQTLYESHSALLLDGMSRDSLYAAIREQFVNVSGYGAASKEISIADMIRDAVPDTVFNPASPDAISAVKAYFTARFAHFLKRDTKDCEDCRKLGNALLSFQNTTGGFAWLKGGPSSPVVTAVVLEYLSVLERKGLSDPGQTLESAAEKAVRYLDRYRFAEERLSIWSGDINLPQYLYVRSLYPEIPFSPDLDRRKLKPFSKEVKDYIYGKEADAPGYILYKARRAMTVLNFAVASEDGKDAFLSSIKLKANKKFGSAIDKSMSSLKEYAVEHRSGGMYYPNAVMPFRGLLENELYAHTVLCSLLSEYGEISGDTRSSEIAEGIRLWIMIQKETQQWDEDPACLLAINAVAEGSPALLSTKVLVLSQKYMKPFSEIKASGNDITVKCRYFVEDDSVNGKDAEYEGYREIEEGDTLKIGDKVMAVYEIWSGENRSFIRLTAPRYASLRPENQLSGMYGITVRPRISVSGLKYFAPYSYREVKSDRSIWYIDTLPEEETFLTESFIVTRSGAFSTPVTDIECVYAPHYRANDGFHPQLLSER